MLIIVTAIQNSLDIFSHLAGGFGLACEDLADANELVVFVVAHLFLIIFVHCLGRLLNKFFLINLAGYVL